MRIKRRTCVCPNEKSKKKTLSLLTGFVVQSWSDHRKKWWSATSTQNAYKTFIQTTSSSLSLFVSLLSHSFSLSLSVTHSFLHRFPSENFGWSSSSNFLLSLPFSLSLFRSLSHSSVLSTFLSLFRSIYLPLSLFRSIYLPLISVSLTQLVVESVLYVCVLSSFHHTVQNFSTGSNHRLFFHPLFPSLSCSVLFYLVSLP